MLNYYTYELSIGMTVIAEEKNAVTEITVIAASEDFEKSGNKKETPVLRQAAKELSEYLSGKRTKFDIPISPSGTAFQKKVWEALITIPYGETRSYKQIAEQIGNPKAARAVGMANHKNPIAIVVPCHRVIGASGALVGYGLGLSMKDMLLKLESDETEWRRSCPRVN